MPEPNALQAWTVERVIAELPQLGWLNQREPLRELSDHHDALCEALRRALHDSVGLAQLNAAVMLLKLQDQTGREVFLKALSGSESTLLKAAMEFLRDLAPHDTRFDGKDHLTTKVPVSSAEIFAAIFPYLQEPKSELGDIALFVCLKNDIELSRAVTRPLLQHASASLRLLVAEWYLRRGRDDGALRAIEALFEAAPSNLSSKEPDWYSLKTSWFSVRDCCRMASEPLRTEAARMAMRIVRATLDAPDWKRGTNFNDGFVDIGSAAEAIACVMPDGAEAVLERIIARDFDDYGTGDDYCRGRAIIALAGVIGARSQNLVRTLLADAAVRQYAARALGGIAKATNDPDDIASLADALAKEDRANVIGPILTALAGIGPDAEPYVKAAIERAPPWTRMKLAWQLEGLSARQIADMLTEAGVMDAIDDAALTEETQKGVNLMGLIWAGGKRLAHMEVKCDSTPPPHHALFKALLDIARPRISVEDLSQRDDDNYRREVVLVPGMPEVMKVTDLGTICTIGFVHAGVAHSFVARPSGRWLDVAAVMEGFNQFMAAIGCEDRCFLLATEGNCFLVAPETKFHKVAERLHIPLEPDADRARCESIDYALQVVAGR